MARLELWSDPHCPYAYLAAWRVRRLLGEFPDVELHHRALSVEYVQGHATAKAAVDVKSPVIALEESEMPFAPFHGTHNDWPSTAYPALEAVACARRQGWRAAHELDWRIREAFFAQSRNTASREVLFDIARHAGLDATRFQDDYDSGACKRDVIEDSRMGWDKLDLQLSPTFVLADGSRFENPACPYVELDEDQHHRIVGIRRPPERADDVYRRMLKAASG